MKGLYEILGGWLFHHPVNVDNCWSQLLVFQCMQIVIVKFDMMLLSEVVIKVR